MENNVVDDTLFRKYEEVGYLFALLLPILDWIAKDLKKLLKNETMLQHI